MLREALAALILAILSATAQASVITFEDIGIAGDVTAPGFLTRGYQFSDNSAVVDVSSTTMWGTDTNGGHSGNFAALNDLGGAMTITRRGGGLFSVSNLWLHGWLGTGDDVVIEAYAGNQLLNAVSASYGAEWQNILLDFVDVDALTILSNGLFYVDDVDVKAATSGVVPEPGSLLLATLALCAAAGMHRRRRGH